MISQIAITKLQLVSSRNYYVKHLTMSHIENVAVVDLISSDSGNEGLVKLLESDFVEVKVKLPILPFTKNEKQEIIQATILEDVIITKRNERNSTYGEAELIPVHKWLQEFDDIVGVESVEEFINRMDEVSPEELSNSVTREEAEMKKLIRTYEYDRKLAEDTVTDLNNLEVRRKDCTLQLKSGIISFIRRRNDLLEEELDRFEVLQLCETNLAEQRMKIQDMYNKKYEGKKRRFDDI